MAKSRTSGQGRPKGVPNKATADIKRLAQHYGPDAIAALAEMSGLEPGTRAESETARIAALRELLDRGYGRASQPPSGDPDAPPLAIDFRWADATPLEPDDAAVEGDWVRRCPGQRHNANHHGNIRCRRVLSVKL
jgi:hypothetical protein